MSLTAELDQVREERDSQINNLQSQLEAKDQVLGRLTADNQRLQDEASKCTPVQSPGNLKQLIKSWRKQSKQTRDWTKANQLLSELEKLIQ